MKYTLIILAALAVIVTAVSCGTKKDTPKVLVLYYSQTGTTKLVADQIASLLPADVEAIEAANPYDGTYQETIARGMADMQNGTLPEIKPLAADLSKYDVIFLGYPIWFGTYAPPVAAWLSSVDLAGKKVVPFCTFGSGGLDESVRDLKDAQPEAEVLPGYGVRAARVDAVPAEVERFLKANGFLEGEYEALEDFSEQRPVTEEEAAIFDAAVGDYPMISAKASTVASRAIPGGVEYLFTAVNLPPAGMPAPPQGGEMMVYVNAIEGEAPVFTQVVR